METDVINDRRTEIFPVIGVDIVPCHYGLNGRIKCLVTWFNILYII